MSYTYEERSADAQHHEWWVLEQLRQRPSVKAKPFGQALFDEELRGWLRSVRTPAGRKAPIRWIPDVIAIKDGNATLIDAKAGHTWKRTGNHDIEKDALTAALAWGWALCVDVWFIFSDGKGMSAAELAKHPQCREGTFLGRGSGTPFYLWPCAIFDQLIEPTPEMDTRTPIHDSIVEERARQLMGEMNQDELNKLVDLLRGIAA